MIRLIPRETKFFELFAELSAAMTEGARLLRGILEDTPYDSKCGVDLFSKYSRDIYAGYLYLDGLDAARAACRDMRVRVDGHPDLGCTVQVTIKRGCSNMEAACGPSDQWTFRAGMQELERDLKTRFKKVASTPIDYKLRRGNSMVRWLQVAYNLKDDTYLAFTGGKPLHQPAVSYPAGDLLDETISTSQESRSLDGVPHEAP